MKSKNKRQAGGRMKLYSEDIETIYLTQNLDPFFGYLTGKVMALMNKKGARVLDLGCGSGRNAMAAARRGYSVVGVDYVKKAVEIGREIAKRQGLEGRITFIHQDLLSLKPGQLGKFDYIILMEVIEHIQEYQQVLDWSYGALKTGGKILITTPNDPGQWTKLDDYARHLRRFTIDEVKRSLANFGNVKVITLGFPLHRLSLTGYNFWQTLRHKQHEPRTFRANRFITGAYFIIGTIIMTLDNLLAFTPWGTTILAVGEK